MAEQSALETRSELQRLALPQVSRRLQHQLEFLEYIYQQVTERNWADIRDYMAQRGRILSDPYSSEQTKQFALDQWDQAIMTVRGNLIQYSRFENREGVVALFLEPFEAKTCPKVEARPRLRASTPLSDQNTFLKYASTCFESNARPEVAPLLETRLEIVAGGGDIKVVATTFAEFGKEGAPKNAGYYAIRSVLNLVTRKFEGTTVPEAVVFYSGEPMKALALDSNKYLDQYFESMDALELCRPETFEARNPRTIRNTDGDDSQSKHLTRDEIRNGTYP